MAHCYVGELSKIDQEVFAAVRTLPDDFWVFAEFFAGRNIDWFVVRASSNGLPSTLILMELKRSSRAIRGDINGTWQQFDDSGEWQEIPPHGTDINYYWQAVNSANALKTWLWNNQRLYRDDADARPQDDFRVWPDLLILSPPEMMHRLPLSPSNRFGQWFYSAEHWVRHVEGWSPKAGVNLSARDLDQLAAVLGLRPVAAEKPAPAALDAPAAFVDWLRQFQERLESLEAQVRSLENALHSAAGEEPASSSRSLTEVEKQALIGAIEDARDTHKSRALPTIVGGMNVRLGYDLKQAGYNGFGTAGAMIEEARREGLVKLGRRSGPNPTIYLPDEPIPA